jgi:hypothetical protein
LTILFLCTSPVAIENITAQVQDVDISTAYWTQFTFWQPRKTAFDKAASRYNGQLAKKIVFWAYFIRFGKRNNFVEDFFFNSSSFSSRI